MILLLTGATMLPPDTLMVEISKTGEQDRTIAIYKKEEEKA